MKNKTKLLLLILLIVLIFPPLFVGKTVKSATSSSTIPYTWEVGIPGFHPTSTKEGSFTGFAKILIQWGFRLAGILAFAMIIFAGFEYAVFSGAAEKQKDAQNRIINAIVGLILLFSFWLILNIINPDILKTKEPSLSKVNIPNNTTTTAQEAPLYLQNFIETAKSYAASKKVFYSSLTTPSYPNYQAYLKAAEETCGKLPPEAYKGASCDVYVATVVNHSIIGPLLSPDYRYPCFGVDKQWYFITNYAKENFECNKFTSLSQVKPGSILFFDRNGIPGPEHTALKLDDGVYQASNGDYYPYGPGPSYSTGTACYWKGFYRGY